MSVKYLLIIAVFGAAVYINTLHNDFVSDDIPAILNNPDIGNIFPAPHTAKLLNSLAYRLGKFNPVWYHAISILLHCVNSVLVFFLLRLFFKARPSFWGGLLFAVHPVHTEAVTWISGRPYLVYTFLLLVSFLLYANAANHVGNDLDRSLRKMYFWASVAVYFIALYDKQAFAFLFPGMLALYDISRGKWRKNWGLWIVFSALTACWILFMLGEVRQRVAFVSFSVGQAGMSNPLFNAVYSIFSHLGLLIWPVNLTLYHEPNVISAGPLAAEIVLLVLLFLSLPLIFRRQKALFFSIGLFILFLAPTYSPVMVASLVAERYLYFPSLAFSMWAALLVEKVERVKGEGSRVKGRWACVAGLVILTGLYSARTIIRNADWRTHASIWRATEKISPLSPRAHNNMGDVYCREGDLGKAAGEFSRAIELRPDYADAYHNLANTYQQMGRIDEAAANYKKAVYFNPGLWQSQQALDMIYRGGGQINLTDQDP